MLVSRHIRAASLVIATATVLAATGAFAESVVRTQPAEAGLSPKGLARIGDYLKNEIATNKIPGAVMMIQRRGKVAYYETFGVRDPATKAPMTANTIFRIYSMSKPITTVAAMMLVERASSSLAIPSRTTFPHSRT